MKKQTEALVEVADAEFNRLLNDTHAAVNALTSFWTKLYGPNTCADDLRGILNAMSDEWNAEEER